ncbi:MAG: glycine cleavage system aminomethyltransferase GcvT [Alphaproteobacteria bacterium]
MPDTPHEPLERTPLHDLHVALGARLVPFAGYAMPVQYAAGIIQEHLWVREKAGLFDVSHMGQIRLTPATGDMAALAGALERITPGDFQALKPGRQRYTLFTNEAGGILDDLMVTHAGDHFHVVVNAACKAADLAHLEASLPEARVEPRFDRALLALQGPGAGDILVRHAPSSADLFFMEGKDMTVAGRAAFVTRSGYTGEDGFEISLAAEEGEGVARLLIEDAACLPIGLGARDSLRLEAGLCLYGHDIDETTTPVEAGLAWAIGKRRRAEGGFPGYETVRAQLESGAPRLRAGLRPDGRQPAREGAAVLDGSGAEVGRITSGGFGPSLGGPVAMGYLPPALSETGQAVHVDIRGKSVTASVAALPFVKPGYRRRSGK